MLPAGVSTFELTFGNTYDFSGTPLRTDLKITPSHEIRTATGERVVPGVIEVSAGEGEFGSIELPHPGQAGLFDLRGNAITNWWYTITAEDSRGGRGAGKAKVWKLQPTVDQVVVDLDTVPTNGVVGPVGSVVPPAVTSVNGLVGAVVVDGASDSSVNAIVADTGSDTFTTLAGAFAPASVVSDVAAVETVIDSGRLSEAALETTIGSIVETSAPKSSAIVLGDGDSITAVNTDSVGNVFGDSWYTHLCALSQGAIQYLYNAGVGGWTSAQLYDALASVVEPRLSAGDWLIWASGRNDQGGSVDTAAYDALVLAWCRARGIRLALTSLTPTGTTALDTPAAPTVTASESGGTLAAGTYTYKIVARNDHGVTLASTGASGVISGSTGSIRLRWAHVKGSVGFDIYRGDVKLVSVTHSTSTGPVLTYNDTGAVTPSGALPGANTTGAAPATSSPTFTAQANARRRRLAEKEGLPFIDFYSVAADPTTGRFVKGGTSDGTHPRPWLQKLMGAAAWAAMQKVVALPNAYVVADQTDPLNIYSNGLFLTTFGSPVDRPGGGFAWPGTTGHTSAIGAVAGFTGNAWTIGRTDPASATYFGEATAISLSGKAVPGDLLRFVCKVETDGVEAGGMRWEVNARFHSGSSYKIGVARWALQADLNDPTILAGPLVAVPSDATHVRVSVALSGGIGTLTTGQWALINYTALGLT